MNERLLYCRLDVDFFIVIISQKSDRPNMRPYDIILK